MYLCNHKKFIKLIVDKFYSQKVIYLICVIVYVLNLFSLINFAGLSFFPFYVPYFWQTHCQSTVFASFEFINIELNK